MSIWRSLLGIRDPSTDELFFRAVDARKPRKVEGMLRSNPELILIRDRDDLTPLHYAAFRGYKDIAQKLLAKGADIDAKAGRGAHIPLHCAAQEGHLDLVQLLLEKNDDVNVPSNEVRP